jgi:diadenosine tetraphosphatase ApaH/serine/threonine PP2A family protein phosphatase
VVLVGDLVRKGPDSAGVVRRVRDIGARAVRGNHDVHFISRGEAGALRADDREWLETLPLFLRLPRHGAIVVHAGLVPGVPLEDQEPEHLLTMRSIRPDGSVSKRVDEGVPWASRWEGPEHVVFGHDAIRKLQLHPHATGLDTGCVYGGELSACIFPGRRIVSVPARRAYARGS